jgi:hypothetical protein
VKKGSSIITLLTIGLLCLSNPSEGANWKLVGRSKDGNMSVSIDNDSIRQGSDNIVRACQKSSYVKPKLSDAFKKPITEVFICRQWDCDEERYNDRQITFRFIDGTEKTEKYEYTLWHHIKQGSNEGDLYDYVCNQE